MFFNPPARLPMLPAFRQQISVMPDQKPLRFRGATVENPPLPPGQFLANTSTSSPTKPETTPSVPLEDAQKREKTFRAFLGANVYQPSYRQLGPVLLPVHNPEIAKRLQAQYSSESLRELFELCRQRDVFSVTFLPPHGLLKTAGTTPEEDSSMGRAHWVSDTLYARELVRDINPELWRKSVSALATYYHSEKPAFIANIQNPELYQSGDSTKGVAHIFEPESLARFKDWQENYRLESHGLALKTFCDEFKESSLSSAPGKAEGSGLDLQNQDAQNRMEAITHLAHYFQAIGYPSARSCGPWENKAFPGGATSDIEAVRAGYESLSDLLFNPAYSANPGIRQLRVGLQQRERQLADEVGKPIPALFKTPSALIRLIGLGHKTVEQRLLARNGPQEVPNGDEMDSALLLATNSTVTLGKTVNDDVRNHLAVLGKMAAGLVRNNGMVRYLPYMASSREMNGPNDPRPHKIPVHDSYLGPNFALAAGPDGIIPGEDKGEVARKALQKQYPDFKERPEEEQNVLIGEALGQPGREAEWFLVSDLSTGYGRQLEKMLTRCEKEKRSPTPEERLLISQSLLGETEMLNRSYARITGSNPNGQPWSKANGEPCLAWKLPEAYQAVSMLDKSGQPGPLKMVPGTNTPLTWATASLYTASKLAMNNLRRLENLGLLPAVSSAFPKS